MGLNRPAPPPDGDTPALRPAGHFRVFLGYCLPFVLVYLLLLIVGIWLSPQMSFVDDHEEDAGYWRAHVRGTHHLLQDRFAGMPQTQWPAEIQRLQRSFAYPITLQTLREAGAGLSAAERAALHGGTLVVVPDTRRTYARLAGTDQAVVLGDLLDYPERDVHWQLTAARVADLVLLLLNSILAIALPLYFLVYRVWADVYALGGAARTLREGPTQAAIPGVRTRLARPLQDALRALSTRLQTLLEGQRILSNAVAHEIRTPLARMRFAVEILRDTDNGHERERMLDGILGDVLRLEQLAEAGIDYSRIGRMQRIDCDAIDVRGLFQQLRTTTAIPPTVTVCLRGSGVCTVRANRAALQLALRNLLGNALRHARSRVQLGVEYSGGWLALTVDDDGPGVAASARERVFQPYVQLQPHTEGFGLGLAIVQVIAEKHDGSADVIDSPLGGARFRILLPL
ncbi:sensor histidine kinase [Stenotrophomonas sp. LGBM10]|uniref:sensor histidine kinase n=1 Tax=Stenotrophomonas sp. LGBM10 TaxID=3390038 RepID=UPI00398BB4FC